MLIQRQQQKSCYIPFKNHVTVLFRIKVGGGGLFAVLPTMFSPVTSTNVGISPQNFLTFSFLPFDTMV